MQPGPWPTAAGSGQGGRGDRAGANAFLAEAGVVAQRLGADRNDFWTVFGPTNVGIHPASVAVELGDVGRVVEQARAIDPSQLPSLERRAHHLLDLAQGYGQWRKDHQALDALLHARTGHPVRHDNKLPGEPDVLPEPDAIIVAPATFNTINKWAAGSPTPCAWPVM